MDSTFNAQPQASLGGYLPNGQKVYFTIPLGNLPPAAAYDYVLNYSQTLFSKGLLLTEPGLEAGEQSYNITHIVRGTQPAKDSKPATPIIYFYHDNLKWSDTKTWLNTPDDIAEFERWSGVKLDTLKSFPAGRLERGKDAQVDSDYVTVLTPARRIIWRLNPDYVDGSKTESKREFARFDIQVTPPAPASGQVSASETREPQQQDVSTTEPAETPKNAVNAENGAKTGNLTTVDETDAWFVQLEPTWNDIKGKLLVNCWTSFWKIVKGAKFYKNDNYARNSISKLQTDGLIVPAEHTLRQAIMVVMSHKDVKYGGNVEKISTEELKRDTLERAKQDIA